MAARYAAGPYYSHTHSPGSDRSSFSSTGSDGYAALVEAQQRKTPRPPNAWILYRSDTIAELKRVRSPDLNRGQGDLSKLIAQQWKNESQMVRRWYEQQAELKKLEHREQNPGYKYQPAPKGSRQKARELLSEFDPSLGTLEEENSPESLYDYDQNVEHYERRPSLADNITHKWMSDPDNSLKFREPPIPQFALDPTMFGKYGMADTRYHDALNSDNDECPPQMSSYRFPPSY